MTKMTCDEGNEGEEKGMWDRGTKGEGGRIKGAGKRENRDGGKFACDEKDGLVERQSRDDKQVGEMTLVGPITRSRLKQ